MDGFGFRKPQSRKRYTRTNRGFAIFCVCGFLLFSIFSSVSTLVQAAPSQELFQQDMAELALYMSTYDERAASVLLSMQRIAQGYEQKDFLKTYKGDIENVLHYLSNNPSRLTQMGLQKYGSAIELLASISQYKGDIFSLLGAEKPQTYLILLQNAAEKRPNGGFFGSFVKVTVSDAKITDLQFIDSYVPGIVRPDVTLQAPDWTSHFLSGEQTITFLASNKFGFTDMDGKNIKKLYDTVYSADIRGVVFINSKLFSDLLPGFQEQLWEWQFKNAAIDLIRGEARPNKKELYFNGVKDFLEHHKYDLIKSIAQNLDHVLDNRYIQTHLVRTNDAFIQTLQTNNLQTVFSPDMIYLWDYNSSYNKIDTFVQKTTTLVSMDGSILRETTQDVMSIAGIPAGNYRLHIQYALTIPNSYVHFIEALSHKFNIDLNVREKHILALYAEWATRGVVYAPQSVTFSSPQGPLKTQSVFDTPFSHNAFYVVENTQNNTIKDVMIPFTITNE